MCGFVVQWWSIPLATSKVQNNGLVLCSFMSNGLGLFWVLDHAELEKRSIMDQ